MRVLHLEDDSLDAFLIRHALESSGFSDIVQISTLEEYQDAISRGGFDVIVSDNRLSGLSGAQALAMARQRGISVPFVMMSGDEMGKDALLQAGVTAFVSKDQLPDLVALLERLRSTPPSL